jgi:hypothetical protein
MPTLDEFESIFRSATRDVFTYDPIDPRCVVVVTDLTRPEAEAYAATLQKYLGATVSRDARWRVVAGGEYEDVGALLSLLEGERAELVCTYRNLKHPAWRWPYSLGSYVEVLTQAWSSPVLLAPSPHHEERRDQALETTRTVLVVTDHIMGDHRLVSWGARCTADGGTLVLAHVESLSMFEHYVDAVSRIPSIDTDLAKETLRQELLKRPQEYIAVCRGKLEEAGLPITVAEHVSLAHRISQVRRLKQELAADLLVLHTKDPAQQAMSQMAYPLAVEIRRVPLLLI